MFFMPRRYTEEHLLKELEKHTRFKGGLTRAAQKYGVYPSHISRAETTRHIPPGLAVKMGYRIVTRYEKVEEGS